MKNIKVRGTLTLPTLIALQGFRTLKINRGGRSTSAFVAFETVEHAMEAHARHQVCGLHQAVSLHCQHHLSLKPKK
jgi:hypothetical protein